MIAQLGKNSANDHLYFTEAGRNGPATRIFLRDRQNVVRRLMRQARSPKLSYGGHEYIAITLTSEIAAVATGIAHAAILQVITADGATLQENVVVKIAFLADQQERMWNEYAVYRRMSEFTYKESPKYTGSSMILKAAPLYSS
ncbi:hypothetical protein C8R44DRAFT_740818 [Mycena epipterygia]|nr:hypothetical protein C8R44DRAFT_740818 [Mycena epipterygia]